MMATALEIADWLVRYRAEDAGAPIDAMSLQKHLFYAQGFHLAIAHEPLFADEMRAWRNGPVVPAVYHRYRNAARLRSSLRRTALRNHWAALSTSFCAAS